MKQYFVKRTLIAGLVLLTIPAFAQKEKEKEKDKNKETEHIVITRTGDNEGKTVIEIDGRDDITLVTEVTRKKGNTKVEKIWYKDNLVWSTEGEEPKFVKVVY